MSAGVSSKWSRWKSSARRSFSAGSSPIVALGVRVPIMARYSSTHLRHTPANRAICPRSVTTTKWKPCALEPLGAHVAASTTLVRISSGTGSGLRRRMARIVAITPNSGASAPTGGSWSAGAERTSSVDMGGDATGMSVVAYAPGRVNLLGEHTDYNGGLALPFAIEAGVTLRATTIPGPFVLARARDLDENDHFELHHPHPAAGWRGFLRGAAAELAWAGNALRPAKLEISGTVPRGRGVGSSSALTVSLAMAMLAMAGIEEDDRLHLARVCSRIEGEWAGG